MYQIRGAVLGKIPFGSGLFLDFNFCRRLQLRNFVLISTILST